MNLLIFTYTDLGEKFCRLVRKEFDDIFITYPKNCDLKYLNRLIENKLINKKNIFRYTGDKHLMSKIVENKISIAFSVGFPFKISNKIISLFKCGAFNIHPGLLPNFRGQHVINWAIISGARETGICIHEMTNKFDEGPIVDQKIIRLNSKDTAKKLNNKMLSGLKPLIKKNLPKIINGNYISKKQNNKNMKYWKARTLSNGQISLGMTCIEADRLVRGLVEPWPGAYIKYRRKKIFIYKVKIIGKKIHLSENKIFFKNNLYICLIDGTIEVLDAVINHKKLTKKIFNSIK